MKFKMYGYMFFGVCAAVMLSSGTSVFGRMAAGLRKGEVNPLPAWNRASPSPLTHLNKGDVGDVDPRGSVRYNVAPNGRIMRGVITRHREVPVDDIGTGLEQAKEECCFPDSY